MKTILSAPEGRLAKGQIVQLLDAVCQAIEPTDNQYGDAVERYETIGKFLAEENSPLHRFEPSVYPQGSMRTKTVIRPVNGKEFDVDLVCEFKLMPDRDPMVVKKMVWDRFRSSDRYKNMAVEKNRCVQIRYAGDFHMDVMPCVPHQAGWTKVGPVWVPDKQLEKWKPSNPVGFAQFVEAAAAKSPRQAHRADMSNAIEAKAADIEPLNVDHSFTKPALIRIIQILKRHRDEYFAENHDRAPISIILTTLATHSYDRSVAQNIYSSMYDLILDVVEGMPRFIQVNHQTAEFWIANPSQHLENFAEKWNSDKDLANSFFAWQRKAVAALRALAEQEAAGLDKLGAELANSFGEVAARQAIRAASSSIREATIQGRTGVTSTGLVVPTGFGIQLASKSPRHTNFGS